MPNSAYGVQPMVMEFEARANRAGSPLASRHGEQVREPFRGIGIDVAGLVQSHSALKLVIDDCKDRNLPRNDHQGLRQDAFHHLPATDFAGLPPAGVFIVIALGLADNVAKDIPSMKLERVEQFMPRIAEPVDAAESSKPDKAIRSIVDHILDGPPWPDDLAEAICDRRRDDDRDISDYF
jgi:hypothetical protein